MGILDELLFGNQFGPQIDPEAETLMGAGGRERLLRLEEERRRREAERLAAQLASPVGKVGVGSTDDAGVHQLAHGFETTVVPAPPDQAPDTSEWPDPFPGPGALLGAQPRPPTSMDPDEIVRRATAEADARRPPVVPPVRRDLPPPEEVNPLERLGAILAGLGDRGQGAIARIGGALQAGPAFDRQRRTETETVRAVMERDPSLTVEQARTISRIPQALTAFFGPRAGPTFGVIGTDNYGSQIYGWIDPRTRTVTPVRADGTTGQPDGQPPPEAAPTGQAFLDSIQDPALRAQIVGITEGRLPYPTGQYARTPAGRRLMAMLNQFDPTFNAATYAVRAATQRDYASGRAATNVRALNTVMGHLDTLNTAIEGLGNFTTLPGALNPIRGAVRGQLDPAYQRARSRFETARSAVASELMRVFREVGASTTEIQHWQSMMSADASPEALQEGIRTAMELINSRLVAMNDTYNRAMGTDRPPTALLSPEALAVYNRLSGRRTDAPPPPGEPPPEQPRTPVAPGPEQDKGPSIPPIPRGVPEGSRWSPSRQQWRAPNGDMFDNLGRKLGT